MLKKAAKKDLVDQVNIGIEFDEHLIWFGKRLTIEELRENQKHKTLRQEMRQRSEDNRRSLNEIVNLDQ